MSSPIDVTSGGYKHLVADVLGGTLKALGVDRAHVIGGSIGDVWALRVAELHPSQIGRVVLVGGGPLLPEIRVPVFIKLLSTPIGAIVVRVPQKPRGLRQQLRQNGHGTNLDAGRIPDEFIRWRIALTDETDSMRNERNMVRALMTMRG